MLRIGTPSAGLGRCATTLAKLPGSDNRICGIAVSDFRLQIMQLEIVSTGWNEKCRTLAKMLLRRTKGVGPACGHLASNALIAES
jgi:hypothetical protein